MKGLVTTQLVDEYQKWLQETENQIKNSKQELTAAMMTGGFNNLPLEMKDYLRKYVAASVKGDTTTFVTDQANVALKYAVGRKYYFPKNIILNPFLSSGLFYLISLDKSISCIRGIWSVFIK